MKKVIAVLLITTLTTGCAVGGTVGDYVSVQGTPKGIEAFADMSNGWIRTGKENPEQPSEFFQHRKNQEAFKTQRNVEAKGFWQKLVN